MLPFVNIPWWTRIWGRVWRQMWSREVSLPARLLRLFMILWYVPILLIGLLFKPWRNTSEMEQNKHPDDTVENGPAPS